MALRWKDDAGWRIENSSFSDFASPYVGNGTLGTRLGVLLLGTDPLAPTWRGSANIVQRQGPLPSGDPDKPLPSFSSFVYDRHQYALPAWNQLALSLDGVAFNPQNGTHTFCQSIDLRTGEAKLLDTWEYAPGKRAGIEMNLCIPRTHAHASFWTLAVKADAGRISATFGLEAEHLEDDLPMHYRREGTRILGTGRTRHRSRPVAQGIAWTSDGQEEGCEIGRASARITLVGSDGVLHVSLFHSIHGGLEADGAEQRVRDDLAALPRDWEDNGAARNRELWKQLWRSALRTDELTAADARLLLVNQYYLLASLDTQPYPLAPLGLSGNNWNGAQLWDADLWLFRVLLPLWPQFARRIVDYRLNLLPVMQAFAQSQGFKGAFFPWMHDETGLNVTPPAYLQEIHLNIWIARAAWNLYQESGDSALLKTVTWPLLRDAADFFASRCEEGSAGEWHLRGVVGPDEGVAERDHTTCDDNVVTNAGVRWLMRTALEAAGRMHGPANPVWKSIAENLMVLPPRADRVIPEHDAYVNAKIKQADAIIAFFLHLHDWPEEVVRATVEFYAEKSAGGPLMSSQIEAGIMMQLGDTQKGLNWLFKRYREYVRGPFLVPFECTCNDTAVMLTGIGGLLQALIYGLYNWEPGSGRPLPRIGDNWEET